MSNEDFIRFTQKILAAELARGKELLEAVGYPDSILYQRLTGRNLGWIAAYGHSWRQEKLAHEADRNVGLLEE